MFDKKTKSLIKLYKLHINSHKTLYKSFNFSYKSQKYKLDDILSEIIYVSRTGISWRMIKSDIYIYILEYYL